MGSCTRVHPIVFTGFSYCDGFVSQLSFFGDYAGADHLRCPKNEVGPAGLGSRPSYVFTGFNHALGSFRTVHSRGRQAVCLDSKLFKTEVLTKLGLANIRMSTSLAREAGHPCG